MKKVGIIADVHYIHKYHDEYDKVKEFNKFIDQVMLEKPEGIISLGDTIDRKFSSQGRVISYPDGSRYQLPFVETVLRTKIPWYQLIGNHDDEDIFKSIEQAAKNLCICSIDTHTEDGNKKPIVIGNVAFWFAQLELKWSEQKQLDELQKIAKIKSMFRKKEIKHVLLLHVDIIRRGGETGFSNRTLEFLSANFDLVISGHEHEFGYIGKSKAIITAPAAFPTWVKKKSNPLRTYNFVDGKLEVEKDWNQPFGYLILDTESESINLEFKPFHPSAGTIEVNYTITGKELHVIKQEWTKILEEIQNTIENYKTLSFCVVLPIISGKMELLTKITLKNDLKKVSNFFDHIYLVEPRFDKIQLERYTLEDEELLPEISKDAVLTRTLHQNLTIIENLKKKNIDIEPEEVSELVKLMMDRDIGFYREKGTFKEISIHMIQNLAEFLKNSSFNLEIDEVDISTIIRRAFD